MPHLSWNEIQERANEFASKWTGETYEKGESQSFWSDFLNIFGVDRRRHGAFFEYAIKKGNGQQGFIDMFWPGKMLAEQKSGGRDLGKANIQAFEYLETMPDHDLPEAIVVSDFASFQFINLETREKTEFSLEKLPNHIKLFGFLLGQTSKNIAEQDPVNRQAAESIALLHNQLRDDNYIGHDLEVLLVRLVFCMFADDSGIFDYNELYSYLKNRTSEDGSDFGPRLMQIFQALNTKVENRQSSLDEVIASLPYVNGGLFAEPIATPYFTSKMRSELLNAMKLDWSKVSPAIFGSMFQGVMDEKQRRNLGAHYTSEKNILKVIKPLFLDDLYDEFNRALRAGPKKKYDELRDLQIKLANLKFLDPACGCGNFLVITYRELRQLEHKIVSKLQANDTKKYLKSEHQADWLATNAEAGVIKVNVDQMYGIEIEEFPSLIAQTALWLTDHQMNIEYSIQSGVTFKRLPLTHSATIVNDNALTKDWAEIINPKELDYILGNPPFVGSKMMTTLMRNELIAQFTGVKNTGVLDFVSAWYAKATAIMKLNHRIKTALVSTNSITQGEQVPILWQYLFNQGVYINFAHQTFKWSNDAKGNAAVYCVIVGFSLNNNTDKSIFEYADIKGDFIENHPVNINAYLIDSPNIFINSRNKPISKILDMSAGNVTYDYGYLIFSEQEMNNFIKQEPLSKKWFKKLIGGNELINGNIRYCLWLKDALPEELRQMPLVLELINKIRQGRLAAKDTGTHRLAERPHQFRDLQNPENFIAIPKTSSENREYIPINFFDENYIPSDSVRIVPGATKYHFGILTSRMHMAWMRTVAGRLKSDYRYSKDIVYNNFIWPETNDTQKTEIEKLAQSVLDARNEYPNATLADLYDPLTMPPSLQLAHKNLDRAVDRLYKSKPFTGDTERVALLFEKYQEKISDGLVKH